MCLLGCTRNDKNVIRVVTVRANKPLLRSLLDVAPSGHWGHERAVVGVEATAPKTTPAQSESRVGWL
jgi:hypothetical protein